MSVCRNVTRLKTDPSLQKGGSNEIHDIEDLVTLGYKVKGLSNTLDAGVLRDSILHVWHSLQPLCANQCNLQNLWHFLHQWKFSESTKLSVQLGCRVCIFCSQGNGNWGRHCVLSLQLHPGPYYSECHGSEHKRGHYCPWWSTVIALPLSCLFF